MKTLTDLKRFNMIEQQIRTWDVFDALILDLYDKIKREEYVPELLVFRNPYNVIYGTMKPFH